METGDKIEKELSPEEVENVLTTLEGNFYTFLLLHEGIEWDDVRNSLIQDHEALRSLAHMQAAGHCPNVYHEDDDYYYFGSCSEQSPPSYGYCVYDRKAAEKLLKTVPHITEEEIVVAEEIASAMGISLMTPDHYLEILQKKFPFDTSTQSILLTPPALRGEEPTAFLLGGRPCLCSPYRLYHPEIYAPNVFESHEPYNTSGSWRGMLKVRKIKK